MRAVTFASPATGDVHATATNSVGVGCTETPWATTRPGMCSALLEELAHRPGRSEPVLCQPSMCGRAGSRPLLPAIAVSTAAGGPAPPFGGTASWVAQFFNRAGLMPCFVARASREALELTASAEAARYFALVANSEGRSASNAGPH